MEPSTSTAFSWVTPRLPTLLLAPSLPTTPQPRRRSLLSDMASVRPLPRLTHTTDIPVWDTDTAPGTDTETATGTARGPLMPRPEWLPCTDPGMPPSLLELGTLGTTVSGQLATARGLPTQKPTLITDTEPVSAMDTELTQTVWAVTTAELTPMGSDTPATEESADTGTVAPTPELTLDKLNHRTRSGTLTVSSCLETVAKANFTRAKF